VPSKQKRGSTPGRSGYGQSEPDSDANPLRYRDVDAELLREVVDAVVQAGDCIQFTRTADAGAYVVRVISDAGNGAWYPPSVEALAVVLGKAGDIARGL
jgi:hypothetical protein